jgi:hypothetical protein
LLGILPMRWVVQSTFGRKKELWMLCRCSLVFHSARLLCIFIKRVPATSATYHSPS